MSVTINDTNQSIYIYEGIIETRKSSSEDITKKNDDDKQTDISENYETKETDLKPKKTRFKSRWAIKRAEQNKKPKFKVSTNYDEVFMKVQISNEDLARCIELEKHSDYYKSKRFKCKQCVLGFTEQKKFIKHNQMYHSNGEIICDICKSKIKNKCHLLSHLSKHYVGYRCTVCQLVCRKGTRACHFETEHKKVFQCVICALYFG